MVAQWFPLLHHNKKVLQVHWLPSAVQKQRIRLILYCSQLEVWTVTCSAEENGWMTTLKNCLSKSEPKMTHGECLLRSGQKSIFPQGSRGHLFLQPYLVAFIQNAGIRHFHIGFIQLLQKTTSHDFPVFLVITIHTGLSSTECRRSIR